MNSPVSTNEDDGTAQVRQVVEFGVRCLALALTSWQAHRRSSVSPSYVEEHPATQVRLTGRGIVPRPHNEPSAFGDAQRRALRALYRLRSSGAIPRIGQAAQEHLSESSLSPGSSTVERLSLRY